MIRIGLVDDQDLVREGIKSLLALTGKIAVAFEARDGDGVLAADRGGLDVLVMDIRMPGRNGIETLRELRRRGDPIPVIMLTTFEEPALFDQAVAAGARGFLRKDVSPEELLAAIESVHAGETAYSPTALQAVRHADGFAASPTGDPTPELTDRERSILRLMAGGYANREIAGMLFLAEGTVKNYVSGILEKLAVRDRTQAVLRAIHLRII